MHSKRALSSTTEHHWRFDSKVGMLVQTYDTTMQAIHLARLSHADSGLAGSTCKRVSLLWLGMGGATRG